MSEHAYKDKSCSPLPGRRQLSPSIPSSPSQNSNLSASPAAMFLSAFMSPPRQSPPKNPDDEGQVIAGYTLGSIIGYGGSSIIRRVSSASGDIAAVKIVRRADLVKAGNAPQARKRLQHEASIWSTLSHEHIIPLFSVVHTPYADYFFTLYCPAGSLFDILKRDGRPALPQDDAGMMFRQVVRGLRYLHEVAQFVHRDIKLENVLLDEMGVCRIGDFGMTRKIGVEDEEEEYEAMQHDQMPDMLSLGNASVHRAVSLTAPSSRPQPRSNLQLNHLMNRHNSARHRNSTATNQPIHVFQPGSLPYVAPELLLPQTSDVLRPHPGQDIWALGVMLYTLLTGRLPFADSFEPRLQMKILSGVYEVPKDIGRGAERILQGCLERDIQKRWNIAMVDEIAWGVGWGAEGDDAAPTDPNDEPELQHKSSTPHSRSRSRPPDLTMPFSADWQQDEPIPRSAFEAASRRSSSRVKRSLSRAPALTPRSARSASRSMSTRSRAPSPTSSTTLTDSMTSSSLASSAPYDIHEESVYPSPLPSPTLERGRRQNKSRQFPSRSPSPSVVPSTPLDGAQVSPLTGVLEQPDELNLDSSRGRPPIRSSNADKSGGRQRAVGFDDEITEWAAQEMDGIEHVGESIPEKEIANSTRRQRPGSSPPWAKARIFGENIPHRPNPEHFLSALSIPSTNLARRSRSAELSRSLDG
ncbi:kinase-like domain-containing protein [Crassisporium funariophilum]|nr:kinase-like domain-containing protein [Crassisporium funariophilum]